MERYAISVIIPCFNAQDYIEETLQSLFDQTFQDFEIICIDDGSTDQTLALLRGIAEDHSNMTVIPETNHRQGYERNQGIRKACGKYVYYMDSDDLLEPEGFQVLFDACEKDSLDLLFFEADSFYEDAGLEEQYAEYKTLYHRKESYPEVYTGEELYVKLRQNGDMIVSPCLQLVRREFLLENEILFPELPLMEDNLYLFRCILAAQRIRCIPDRLYQRRVRVSSTMTSARNEERQYALGVTFCEMVGQAAAYAEKEEVYDAILNHALGIIRQLGRVCGEWRREVQSKIAAACTAVPIEEELLLLLRLDEKYLQTNQNWKEKLQKAWEEKSELNRKLQITYDEKAERGIRIKELEAQLKDLKVQSREEKKGLQKELKKKTNALKETKKELAKTKKELKELNGRFLVRVSQKLHSLLKR